MTELYKAPEDLDKMESINETVHWVNIQRPGGQTGFFYR